MIKELISVVLLGNLIACASGPKPKEDEEVAPSAQDGGEALGDVPLEGDDLTAAMEGEGAVSAEFDSLVDESAPPEVRTTQSPPSLPSGFQVSPRVQMLAAGKDVTFSASGGAGPYQYRVSQGEGSIDPRTGVFRATPSPGEAVITATDSSGASADALVLVVPGLALLPPSGETSAGESFRVAASGGVQPYRYRIAAGPGQIDSEGGFSSGEGGQATIEVTDAGGSTAQATVTVYPPLSISPRTAELAVTNSREFKAEGGVPPYTFELKAGVGSLQSGGSEVANFSAGDQPGDAAIRVIDSRGAKVDARALVRPMMIAHPKSRAILAGESVPFLVTGGVNGHSIELKKGEGKIENGAVYVAPKRASEEIIEVRDSAGNKLEITLSVIGAGSKPAEVAAVAASPPAPSPDAPAAPEAPSSTPLEPEPSASNEIDPVTPNPDGLMINAVFSRRISGGFGHTCAVLGDSLKCWGSNKYGQLGNGTTKASRRPVDPQGLPRGVIAVVTGFYHTCTLLAGGSVRCWGDNRYGQLGNNTVAPSSVPQEVYGLSGGVKAISAGQFHTCALRGTSVYCWGDNRRGQLGDGTRISSAVPLSPIGMGSGVTSLGAGSHHSCALKENNIYCWGFNRAGQLGTGLLKESFTPVQVQKLEPGELRLLAVDAKGSHSCALLGESLGVNTQMKCWGYNGPGNLGDRSTEFRYVPKLVADLDEGVQSMSLGYTHTCAVMKDGTSAKCWGQNVLGQLGDGTTTQYRFAPVPVRGLPGGIEAVATGVGHSCALYPDGVWCWGSNALGQFGNGGGGGVRALAKKSFKVKVTQ